jgi:hypothetical protein
MQTSAWYTNLCVLDYHHPEACNESGTSAADHKDAGKFSSTFISSDFFF